MLSKEQNELLTQTGPGTPMGDVIRRYWIPVFLSSELSEPDCPPIRVKVLGENLVGFRDTNGKIGLLDEFCAHRGSSLWFGRNEEAGLRCVFHGWKYDINGNCVDMPNVPEEERSFREKIHLRAYPTVEFAGMIWAYMGPKEKIPPLPKFEWTQFPASHIHLTKTWQECNWLQALEGGLDTGHVSFLHWGLAHRGYKPVGKEDPLGFRMRQKALELEVDITDYGYRYAGIRNLGDQGMYVRGYHFVMPWTQIRPTQARTAVKTKSGKAEWLPTIAGHFWVPMDDENCMVWNWDYSFGEQPLIDEDRVDDSAGPEHVYNDQNFRKKRNKDNNYLIDRELQKTNSFTGIYGVNTQDHAIQEGMGPIVDRTQEHLVSTDKAIITARRLLFEAIQKVQEGSDPPGVAPTYYNLRAIEKLIPKEADWKAELLPLMYPQG